MNPVCCVCKSSQNEESGMMIYYCACTGGPASAHSACISALVSAGNLAESHLCETCSRTILVDKGDCLSLKMSSTLELAAPSVIDADLSWKTDQRTPQGMKRASRRARTALTAGIKKAPPQEASSLIETNRDIASKKVDNISVSESEKLGVSILGRRFSDTIVSVPIKKRRIPFLRSPSPPPRSPAPQYTEPDCDTVKTSHEEPEESLVDQDNDCHVSESHNLPKELKEVVNIPDACSSELKMKEIVPVEPISPPKQGGDAADFSGLSVLATAACNSGSESIVHPSKTAAIHVPSGNGSMPTIGVKNDRLLEHSEGYDQHETTYGPVRADVDDGNDFSVGPTKISDGVRVVQKGYDSDGVYTSVLIHTPSSLLGLNKLPTSTQNCKGREASGKTESCSTWKDRASWDLNTVMDEWGSPSHDPGSATGEDGVDKGSASNLERHQTRIDVEDVREENLPVEKASDYLIQNIANDDGETGAEYEVAHCNVSQLHMQLCLPSSSESATSRDLTDCSSSRVDEYVVEHAKTVYLGKSELQSLVLDTKLSEEPVDSGHTCENCIEEASNYKGLPGAQDDALVTTGLLPVDVKIDNNGSSEKQCSHVAAVATRIVDKVVEPSGSEPISSNEGMFNTHAGINACGSSDHGFEPANDTAVQVNNHENNVIIDISSHPQRKCEEILEGKTDVMADEVDRHLVTDLGTSLVINEMDRSSDQNQRILSPTGVEGEENSVKGGDAANVSCLLGIAVTKSSHTAGTHCLSLVEKVNDDISCVNNVTKECFTDSLGRLEVPLPEVDNGKQVEECPDISIHGQPSDLLDGNNEKNPVCTGMETNLISGDPVSVELSCHSDASRSYNDDYITSLVEDVRFDNCDSDYESDVSPRIEINDMQISDELHGEDDQFEDGEFRSIVHAWDEATAENVEAEPVDYDYSDNRDVNDHVIAVDVYNTQSLQVQNLESKGKALLESIPSVISDEPTCTANNVKESCSRAGQGDLFQAEGSDSGPRRNRPLKVRKVAKSQTGRTQAVLKIDSSINIVEESSLVEADMDIHPIENDVEIGNSSSPILNTTARSSSPNICENSQEPRSTDDISSKRNREDVGPDAQSAGGSVRRGRMAMGRELSSQIEVPQSSDAEIGKEIRARGSRLGTCDDDANQQLERPVARGPSIGRGSSMHVPTRRGESDWLDPPGEYWNRNRRRSPIYYGPSDFSRPVNASAKLHNSGCVIAPDGTIVRTGRMGGRISRQTASLRSLRGAPGRRGSPTDQDEDLGFNIQLGIESVRDISPRRVLNVNRERSRGYGPRMLRLNPRERYQDALDDERIGSSIHMDRAVSRRERSFSPGRRRISPLSVSQSHAKSPRRSRTRSPRIWTSRRRDEIGLEEGQGLRRRSRSPNFRSDVRIDRIKSPRSRSIFVEHMDGFVPTSRDHSPPPRVSRWIDERRDVGQFREHGFRRPALDRSPSGRVFARGRHRYDMLGSPRRVRADEYFRSLHSDRSPELDVDCREPRYDISEDEERKHGDRYVVEHPVRPFNIDGDDRRFRYELGDGYRLHGSRGNPVEFHRRGSLRDNHRAIESRLGDPSRRVSSRGPAGHFSYDREGRNKRDFRLLEVRDSDDDMSSRRRRP